MAATAGVLPRPWLSRFAGRRPMAAPFLLCARAEVVAGVETKLPAGDLNHHADHELKQANDLGRLHQVLFNLLLFRDKLRSPLIAFANRL